MGEEFIIIDKEQALKDLQEVDNKRKETEKAVDRTVDESYKKVNSAITAAQSAWMLTTTVLEASGISISGVTKAVVNSAFLVGRTLVDLAAALATAATVDPLLIAQAILAGIAATASIAAAVAAQQEQQELTASISSTTGVINEMNNFIGGGNFL